MPRRLGTWLIGALFTSVAAAAASPLAAGEPVQVAVTAFDFLQTDDPITGGIPNGPERQRLSAAESAVRNWFETQQGTRVGERPEAAGRQLRRCESCVRELGRRVGADWVTVGWVQKVSELILNMNLVVWDVGSGRRLAAGSVDMRGNTDESWRRASHRLLENLRPQLAGARATAPPPARSP